MMVAGEAVGPGVGSAVVGSAVLGAGVLGACVGTRDGDEGMSANVEKYLGVISIWSVGDVILISSIDTSKCSWEVRVVYAIIEQEVTMRFFHEQSLDNYPSRIRRDHYTTIMFIGPIIDYQLALEI